MRKALFFAAFAAMLSLVSCQKIQDGANQPGSGTEVGKKAPVFTATIAKGLTKVTVAMDKDGQGKPFGKVSWEVGDKLDITDASDNTATYEVSSVYEQSGEAILSYVSGDILGDSPYSAVYGAEPKTRQTYTENDSDLQKVGLYMTAESSTATLTFTVKNAIVQFNLQKTDVAIDSIVVTGVPEKETDPVSYTLICKKGEEGESQSIDVEDPKPFCINLPAGRYDKFEFYNSEGKECHLKIAEEKDVIELAANTIVPITLDNESEIFDFREVVKSIKLNKAATALTIDGTEELEATLSEDAAPVGGVTWSSNDEDVATVAQDKDDDKKCTVTAVGAGEAKIIATIEDAGKTYSDTCVVTVGKKTRTITVPQSPVVLAYLEAKTVTITCADKGDDEYVFTYSPEGVATIAQDGAVTTVKPGTTTVTVKLAATDTYAEATASFGVTVNKATRTITVPADFTMKYKATENVSITCEQKGDTENFGFAYDKADIVAVNAAGTQITASDAGQVKVTVSLAGNDYYNAAEEKSFYVTVNKTYKKVTKMATDCSGTYLIVNENSQNAFAYDQSKYKKAVTINNSTIEACDLGKYEVVLSLADTEGDHHTVKTGGGYLYRTTSDTQNFLHENPNDGDTKYYANKTECSNGNVSLPIKSKKGSTSGTTYYFRYDSSNGFCFNSSAPNRASNYIQFYELDDSTPTPTPTPSDEKTYTKVTDISEGTYLICGSEDNGTYVCLFPPVTASGKTFDTTNMCEHTQFSTSKSITEIKTSDASIIGSEVEITKSGSNWLVKVKAKGQYMYFYNKEIAFTSNTSSAAHTISLSSGKGPMKNGDYEFYHSDSNAGFGYYHDKKAKNLMFFKLSE